MNNQDSIIEYLSSPAGINKIIFAIIIVAAINFIFISYSISKTYRASIKEKEKQRLQQQKINKLSPKKK